MSNTFWPGTAIHKSTGNAFDWRGRPSSIAESDPTYYRPRKPAKAPVTGFAANGGTIAGMGPAFIDIKPRPLVHVSKAVRAA